MFGRVLVIEQQQAAQANDSCSIQIECADRRTRRWSQANEVGVIGAPRKMFAPGVPARMEERHALACDWIKRVRLIEFGTVAALAGQREIVFLACAATAFRDDMFGGVELRGAKFGRKAILAITMRALPNESTPPGWNALFSHAAQV